MGSPLGFHLVIDMVIRKIDNQIRFLKKLMHARPDKEAFFTAPIQAIERIKSDFHFHETDIESARNSLMGLEGTAARIYFECLSSLIPEKYQFQGRSRRPAKNPFNACLNYCYGMLYPLVEKACILSGLDPLCRILTHGQLQQEVPCF